MATVQQFGNPANFNTTPATRANGDASALEVDSTGNLKVTVGSFYSNQMTVLTSSSGNVANASAVATLAATAAKTTWITGFEITAGGATASAVVVSTVVGVLGGTMSYIFAAPAGATVGATPLVVMFDNPIPGSAVNTAIVVTLPALGAGNTNAAVVAHGFVI